MHLALQERNDLSSKANPFSPQELEKWYAQKQQTNVEFDRVASYLPSGQPKLGGGAKSKAVTDALDPDSRGHGRVHTSKFSWDLNSEDLIIDGHISAGRCYLGVGSWAVGRLAFGHLAFEHLRLHWHLALVFEHLILVFGHLAFGICFGIGV